MKLIQYLCDTGFTQFEAQGIILSGKVTINNNINTSINYIIKKDDKIEIKYIKKKYATRSGYKLEKALTSFNIDVSSKTCMDIGASEGGFTDCLIQSGASKVYAVDVAYGILNWKLRSNPKVIPIERLNARYINKDTIDEQVDIITIDVSFISTRKIIPNTTELLKENGNYIILFKPQFELDATHVGKNGNIKDPSQITNELIAYTQYMKQNNITITNMDYSPIKGNNGNTEFLLSAGISELMPLSEDKIKECIYLAFN